MRLQTILSGTIGAVLLAGALVYGFQTPPEQGVLSKPQKTLVKVQAARETVGGHLAVFSAVTRPKRHAQLSFTVPARLTTRPVEIGDMVQASQLLATLDVGEFDNALKSAKAAVDELQVRLVQAERDSRRYQELAKSKAVPTSVKEQYSSNCEQLRVALAGARVKLAEAGRLRKEAELRAPFSGVVNKVHLEPGEWAKAGQPVLELIDASETELEVEVPETIIGQLQNGQQVDVRLPFLDNTMISGTIDHLARATMSAGRLFPVLIRLEKAPQLIPGMTAELQVRIYGQPSLLVPASAVINPGGSHPSLFVLQGDTVHEVAIDLKRFLGEQVMVTGELSPGDLIVISGQTTLLDGKRVEVGS